MKKYIILLLLFSLWGCEMLTDEPKAGETWCYALYKDDPFEDSKVSCYEVLEVKNGCVRHKNTSTGSIKSDSRKWFLTGSYLKKETKR